ncbi:NAD(P)/FAD-dependent oxidoreductase [bacterium]|nr:NAD(P)/FAD-dependent oxidoreductase [bacterium]
MSGESGSFANDSHCWDVAVIGAGASGLLAAIRSAERGFRTVLLEKNAKPGVKILMSGGTRCNITHDTDAAGIMQAFGRQGRFLRDALSALSPADVVSLFHAEGVQTKIESTGKIFPQSDRALDVQQALLARLHRSQASLRLRESVQSIEQHAGGFVIQTTNQSVKAARLIVSTGGQSYPGCGTTGDGYRWLAEMGHTIVTPRPSLVPITSSAEWVKDLSGITLPDVTMRVVKREDWESRRDPLERLSFARKKPLAERRGSLLLAHFGLTGPVALDVSRAVTSSSSPHLTLLVADLVPGVSLEQLDEGLRYQCEAHGSRSLAKLLPESLPHRLVDQLLRVVGVPPDLRAAELSREDRRRLVVTFKGVDIPVTGTRGFTKAEVTAGGVTLGEVDPKSMQSRIVPNLFIVGEVLDLDGWIGGYNFQSAFSTAWLAAESLS